MAVRPARIDCLKNNFMVMFFIFATSLATMIAMMFLLIASL
jgi:hypothetical protein